MNNENNRSAIAGTLAAVMLAATIAGSGGSTPHPGGFDNAVGTLAQAVVQLEEKARERGMTLPATEEGETVGINAIIEGLDGMVPASGVDMEVKVSKEGTISDGDYLRVCQEFSTGDTVRFATGGVKVIATARSVVGAISDDAIDQTSRIAVLFTQDGDTKLKTFDMGDEIMMGTTVTVLEGEALQYADMSMDYRHNCYIVYNLDGDGVMTAVQCGANRVNTVLWTDIWMDGGDPENIRIAVDQSRGDGEIVCTRLPANSINDDDREAVLLDMVLDPKTNGIVNLRPEIVLTPEGCPALYGIDYSIDAFAAGWDVEFAHYWYDWYDGYEEDAPGIYKSSIYITYPSASESRSGIIYAERPHSRYNEEAYDTVVTGYALSMTYGALPCVDMERVCTGDAMGHISGVMVATGVSRLVKEGRYTYNKTYLSMQLYSVSNEGQRPFCIWMGETDRRYSSNISNVSAGHLADGSAYIAFSQYSSMYAGIVEFHGSRAVIGPMVNVGTFRTYNKLQSVDDDRVALIYDTSGGDGYIRLLTTERVVAETDVEHAEGRALEGGTVGSTILANISYWPVQEEDRE